MTDHDASLPDREPPQAPPPDSPPLGGVGRPRGAVPSGRQGAARADAVPRMEHVRITAPDLARRRAMDKTRRRLRLTSLGFGALFVALAFKLALATVIDPRLPKRDTVSIAQVVAKLSEPVSATMATDHRATITDRNGQPLAISLPSVALFADPRQIIDPVDAARKLKQILPRIDEADIAKRLSDTTRQFVFIDRQISPREELAVNMLGIPGVDFQPTEVRRYPMGRVVSQVLGGVNVDDHGAAGVEKSFNKRLKTDPTPLRLSIDVRVQAVVRDELSKAMDEFQAIGACGIVMDVNTGEVLAMVSLPDFNPNNFKTSTSDEQFNRAISGLYEPGSTFKLQTASMALDYGLVHIWDQFDASRPLHIGRFTITDFEGKHRWLYLPEVLAYSSNLGAAHIALDVGGERQRAWLRNMGMFAPAPIQLPGAAIPQYQRPQTWGEATVMTVGFGHGISIEPLQVVRGTAAVANGGVLVRPTILAMPPSTVPEGERVMQESTSLLMRKLMRLVVTDGYGKPANVPGYYVGGKTGTAEKVGAHGYRKHTNVSAFISVFPMNAPRYAVYMMLDEPHGNKSTGGFSTAGAVAAPAAGRVIARIAPMLGLLPDLQDAPQINQALYIPLQPARPPGAPKLIAVDSGTAGEPAPDQVPAAPSPPSPSKRAAPLRGDPRHEAASTHRPMAPILDVSTSAARGASH
jgi:cell division protein FtsI (penicillin-binding protein 3)